MVDARILSKWRRRLRRTAPCPVCKSPKRFFIYGPETPWRHDLDSKGLSYIIAYNCFWCRCKGCGWEATLEAYLCHYYPRGPREPVAPEKTRWRQLHGVARIQKDDPDRAFLQVVGPIAEYLDWWQAKFADLPREQNRDARRESQKWRAWRRGMLRDWWRLQLGHQTHPWPSETVPRG